MAQSQSKPVPTLDELDWRYNRVFHMMRVVFVGAAAYAAVKVQWQKLLISFFTGPGKISRVLLLLWVVFNWKNMPFVWTRRLVYAIYYHLLINRAPNLGPRALFRPMISETSAPLTEIDYLMHKSNSTYFSDLDIARVHLTSHILRVGWRRLNHNVETGIVIDDTTGKPRRGRLSIIPGAVTCSFRREIKPLARYEIWTRILAWDRKWLYMVSHFVPAGVARPSEYLDPRFGRLRTRKGGPDGKEARAWEGKVYATAVTKYVSKIGRFTIHPSIIMEEGGMLPPRPGLGWRGGPNGCGDEVPDEELETGEGQGSEGGATTWDWKAVEKRRRAGMKFAQGFNDLDGLEMWFDQGDGGDGSAVGRFGFSAPLW